jgi:hypothetical protein
MELEVEIFKLMEVILRDFKLVLLVSKCFSFKGVCDQLDDLLWLMHVLVDLLLHVPANVNPLFKFNVFLVAKVADKRPDAYKE